MTYVPNFHPRLAQKLSDGNFKGDVLAYLNDGYVITDRHMLVNPNKPGQIVHKLLPEAGTQPKITPRLAILHTQAGGSKASNENMWSYINRASNLEPHIIGPEMATGNVIQCVPFNVRADVNAAANSFQLLDRPGTFGALSAETQDNGGATVNQTPWTWPQIGFLVGWLTAACFTYQFSCGDVPHPKGSGIAPHNRWNEWSMSAHSCPGSARTVQMDGIRGAVATRLADIYQHCGENCPGG